MSAGLDSTASLLVRRQASFDKQHVQPRVGSFSATVVNRFFTDSSLGRQKRLLETTRRRQTKAREKALEQLELEESLRLKALKEERELSRMERKLQNAAATYIQYVWRKHRYFATLNAKRDRAARFERRRREATAVLQRAWRAQLSKKKIARCSRAYRHLKELEKLERNTKVLQRALATRAAYCRLIRSSELARYPHVMATALPMINLVEAQAELQQSRRIQSEAALAAKRLSSQEAALTSNVERLQVRLCEAKAELTREQGKLERFRALDAHRRSKDDAEIQHRLQTLETQMRRDVRMELEKELEELRRAQARELGKRQKQVMDKAQWAPPLGTSGRQAMRKSVTAAGSSSELSSDSPAAATEERHE
ncbi:hypothetical protein PybrP1_006569 [[Pythium] brassicae (nom. inval.)]|nr:hypothetical protein PybrP1_006569 [[Pythium] brassicae (nom. inval.)]